MVAPGHMRRRGQHAGYRSEWRRAFVALRERHKKFVYVESFYFFFFNDTATPEIYPLSLHDALPIADVPVPERPGRSRGERAEPGLPGRVSEADPLGPGRCPEWSAGRQPEDAPRQDPPGEPARGPSGSAGGPRAPLPRPGAGPGGLGGAPPRAARPGPLRAGWGPPPGFPAPGGGAGWSGRCPPARGRAWRWSPRAST